MYSLKHHFRCQGKKNPEILKDVKDLQRVDVEENEGIGIKLVNH